MQLNMYVSEVHYDKRPNGEIYRVGIHLNSPPNSDHTLTGMLTISTIIPERVAKLVAGGKFRIEIIPDEDS